MRYHCSIAIDMKSLAFLLALISVVALTESATDKIFCYYGSWAVYRQAPGTFDIEQIDPFRCSHITYSFLGLNEDGTVRILDVSNEIGRNALGRFVGLRQTNPRLKVLISMGGWNEGSERYSRVVGNPVTRTRLVNSVYDFVTQWGFDGFDFDWEYPAANGGQPNDYVTYIDFLRELRIRFGTRLLMTAAVGADADLVGVSYNVQAMNQYLDYINLMTYDFNGSWNVRTGINSPLFPHSTDTNRVFNIDYAVRHWINNGASREKLFLGLGFYARTFTLADPAVNGLHAPTIGPGEPGQYSNEGGLMMYNEICQELNRGGWTVIFDTEQQSPYAFKGNQWWGYDNAQSIRVKSQYAVQQGLAGVMIWALDYEDVHNQCGTGWNPLFAAIWSVIYF